jgi:predicted AAA+ superfamily ATPase
MLNRLKLTRRVQTCLREAPVTVLSGARQVGKSTLARAIASARRAHAYFDLENASDRRALENPELTLGPLKGLVVIDEIQRMPGLFADLRPLADRPGKQAVFLLLGSASPSLVKGASESLAGRAYFVDVPGFSLEEVGANHLDRLWMRGGFPRAYLENRDDARERWMDGFLTALVERDVPQLGLRVPAPALQRFWSVLAHYHGQIWNASELARVMGVNPVTARHYLDILDGLGLVRVLAPWYENLKKRQVKAPKVYFRDSGVYHHLAGISTARQLASHPKRGASWEGFALEQTLIHWGSKDAYYWATQSGAELDLLLIKKGRRFGVEFKCADAPDVTRSMHVALEDLKLEKLYVVYPGMRRYTLGSKVEAVPLLDLPRLG